MADNTRQMPVVEEMDKAGALKLTRSIKRRMDKMETDSEALRDEIVRAHDGRAWTALGYKSWAEYTDAEFRMSRRRSYYLLAWSEFNTQMAAIGAAPAATEGEARRRATEARAEGVNSVHTSEDKPAGQRPKTTKSPQRSSVDPIEATATEKKAESGPAPALLQHEEPRSPRQDVQAVDAERSEPAAEASGTDSESAAEVLLKCKPVDAREWEPLLFARLESWVKQAKAARQPPRPTYSPAPVCRHRDAAGKETVNKLGWGVVCLQCGNKIR